MLFFRSLFFPLLAVRATYRTMNIREARKTYCKLLSFNGAIRNPSPVDCERQARKSAFDICNYMKGQGLAEPTDDGRCLSFLTNRNLLNESECSFDDGLPYLIRARCPRFNRGATEASSKLDKFHLYDLFEGISALNSDSAERLRLSIFDASVFNYFDQFYWVFKRETRCEGMVGTGVVPVEDPSCSEYFSDESTSVCSYLRVIMDDVWDLGCRRVGKTIIDLSQAHCSILYNEDIPDVAAFCSQKPAGDEPFCDAVRLICSWTVWEGQDVAFTPYLLQDDVIAHITFYREGEGPYYSAYETGEADRIRRLASLDLLNNFIKGYRPEFAEANFEFSQ